MKPKLRQTSAGERRDYSNAKQDITARGLPLNSHNKNNSERCEPQQVYGSFEFIRHLFNKSNDDE